MKLSTPLLCGLLATANAQSRYYNSSVTVSDITLTSTMMVTVTGATSDASSVDTTAPLAAPTTASVAPSSSAVPVPSSQRPVNISEAANPGTITVTDVEPCSTSSADPIADSESPTMSAIAEVLTVTESEPCPDTLTTTGTTTITNTITVTRSGFPIIETLPAITANEIKAPPAANSQTTEPASSPETTEALCVTCAEESSSNPEATSTIVLTSIIYVTQCMCEPTTSVLLAPPPATTASSTSHHCHTCSGQSPSVPVAILEADCTGEACVSQISSINGFSGTPTVVIDATTGLQPVSTLINNPTTGLRPPVSQETAAASSPPVPIDITQVNKATTNGLTLVSLALVAPILLVLTL